MSEQLLSDISATCSSLGISDGVTYYPDPQCLESVRDLMRYLRRDDNTFAVRRQIGESQALVTDLIPILEKTHNNLDMYNNVLKLLVNLTTPALMLFKEAIPTDKDEYMLYMQIIGHLQIYKKAFADQERSFWKIVKDKVIDILRIDAKERLEDQSALIEHSLILLRNILHVPSDRAAERRTDNDASLHDELIWVLHVSGVLDLLVFLTSSEDENIFYMHVLEIVCWLLREQTPKLLAEAVVERSVEEKERDANELEILRQSELSAKADKMKSRAPGYRHSRFGGTLVVKDVKSISDNDHIVHKPLHALNDALNFDIEKKRKKTPKNRSHLKTDISERRSAFAIRLLLHEFCGEILVDSYNPLMRAIKRMLDHEASQQYDETFYLWALKFFMEFNRLNEFKVELVSETMSYQIFHYVFMRLDETHQNMIIEKKKYHPWSKRLHTTLQALKELLMFLQRMTIDRSNDVRDSADIIQSNLFYVAEHRESLLNLILKYNHVKSSTPFLTDLVETLHVYIALLKKFCACNNRVLTSKKLKKKKKTNKKKKADVPPPVNKEELWSEIGSEVSSVLQDGRELTSECFPFDAASDKSNEVQKAEAMHKIQAHLLANEPEDAVVLLRASRNIWPEHDSFGSSDIGPDEEFMALYDIFMANFGDSSANPEPSEANPVPSDDGSEEADDEGYAEQSSESALEFKEFINKLVRPQIMEPYTFLLDQFETNTVFTNHCVLKMLVRLSFELKLPSMLFHLSLFNTLRRILASKNPQHKPLIEFARAVVKKFCKLAEKNSQVAVEALFWSTHAEAQIIMDGNYSEFKPSVKETLPETWSAEEEEDLMNQFERFREMKNPVLLIYKALTIKRPRKQIAEKLNALKHHVTSNRENVSETWSQEEEDELVVLFNRFHEFRKPLASIYKSLTVKRSRNEIKAKLIALGLTDGTWKGINQNGQHHSSDTNESSSAAEVDDSDQERFKIDAKKIRRAAKELKNQSADASSTVSWLAEKMSATFVERCAADDIDNQVELLFSDNNEIDQVLDTDASKELCKALGLEQETFLKIPETLKSAELEIMVKILRDVLQGVESVDDDDPSTSGVGVSNLKKKTRGKIQQKSGKSSDLIATSDDFSSTDDEPSTLGVGVSNLNNETLGKTQQKSGKSSDLIATSDDFSSTDDEPSTLGVGVSNLNNETHGKTQQKNGKRSSSIIATSDDSSSEDDSRRPSPIPRITTTAKKSGAQIISSDESSDGVETIGLSKNRSVTSISDPVPNDGNLVVKPQRKKSHAMVISSDSEHSDSDVLLTESIVENGDNKENNESSNNVLSSNDRNLVVKPQIKKSHVLLISSDSENGDSDVLLTESVVENGDNQKTKESSNNVLGSNDQNLVVKPQIKKSHALLISSDSENSDSDVLLTESIVENGVNQSSRNVLGSNDSSHEGSHNRVLVLNGKATSHETIDSELNQDVTASDTAKKRSRILLISSDEDDDNASAPASKKGAF